MGKDSQQVQFVPWHSIMISINVFDGEIDGEIFITNLKNEILTKMNPYPQDNSVLILDNASTHDHEQIFEICDRLNVIVLFLPPYSNDYNPLELAFHEAKHYLTVRYGQASFKVKGRLTEALCHVQINNTVNYFAYMPYFNVSDTEREWAMSLVVDELIWLVIDSGLNWIIFNCYIYLYLYLFVTH